MNGLLSAQQAVIYLMRAAVMLIALPFHESAHALVSHWLGDDTAKNAGRLSLNPLRHFDPWGALCMVVGGVGWAKPVGIDVRNYKNPKLGMAVSAAAGPLSNLLLAWVSMVVYRALWCALTAARVETLSTALWVVLRFLWLMIAMNISLAVFNLIPVPPFDGSRIALLFLPQKYYFLAMRYERYVMLLVLGLVFLGLLDTPLGMAVNAVEGALYGTTGFVDLIFGV